MPPLNLEWNGEWSLTGWVQYKAFALKGQGYFKNCIDS